VHNATDVGVQHPFNDCLIEFPCTSDLVTDTCVVDPDIDSAEMDESLPVQENHPFAPADVGCDSPNLFAIRMQPFDCLGSG